MWCDRQIETRMEIMYGHDHFGKASGHHFAGARDDDEAFSPWEAFSSLRQSFATRAGIRMGRGDVRAAILVLLAEQPMHGYQLMHEMSARSGGSWRPSPGSVYPTLQMLDDEGLVDVEQSDGRKVYTLTEDGRKEAEEIGDGASLWGRTGWPGRNSELPRSGARLAQAVAQVMRGGTQEEIDLAVKTLDDARKSIYAMLAGER